jgi:hypothetical protein
MSADVTDADASPKWVPTIPDIDEDHIREMLLAELQRHQADVAGGKVVPRSHSVRKGNMSVFYSLQRIQELLESVFGTWLPGNLWYVAIPIARLRDASFAAFEDERELDDAVDRLMAALKAAHHHLLRMLSRVVERMNAADAETDVGQASAAGAIMAILTRETGEHTSCDDRWFYQLAREGSFCLAALGIDITEDELDTLADGYFESWTPPDEDAIERFADEVSSFVAKRMFELRYPPSKDDAALS